MTRSTWSISPVLFVVLTLACSDAIEGPSNDEPLNFEEHYPTVVVPDDVQLGDVAFGDEASETFAVENVGEGDLEIRGWTVEAPFELVAPSADAPLIVESDESATFEVHLSAEAFDDVEVSTELSGRIELESNDRDDSHHEIEVTATLLVPCLEADINEAYDFGEAPRDATSAKVVEIRNCDDATDLFVEIDEVGGDAVFSALFGGLTGTESAVVEPGESVELWVMFRPETPEAKEATVQLSTNAPSTDRGYGPSIATIRIFFEGFLHTELTSDAFETGQFWDALRLR